jgi:ATP-binding cassette, subfamily B, bacterial
VRLMKPYTRQAAAMMALLLVGIGLDLVSPQLTRFLVDRVLPGSPAAAAELQQDAGSFARAAGLLLKVVLILGLVQVLRMWVNIVNGRLGSRVGTAITFDMRARIVQHLLRLSVGFYDRQQVGSLVGRVAYDTEALHGFIWQLTGGFLLQILMVLGVAIMMFSIDTRLALFALLPAPLVMGGTVFFWRYIYPRYYVSWDASSKQAGTLTGMLSGVRVVKAFSQEARELQRFNSTSDRLRASKNDVDRSIATFNPVIGLVFQIGGWIVWYFGGREVLRGRLTLGELMAFFGYLWMFYGPLASLPQFTNWLTAFATQANRIFEILDTPAAIGEASHPVRLEPMRGEIRFENVSFGYTPHAPVIREMSFHIPAGEMLGVVGSSGSGKSTIVNLICRFYDVDDGRVLIDGVDARDLAVGELRSQVGVVLQEPFLFRGTIAENLLYGRPDALPEDLLSAAKAGNCHDFVMRQPYAYDTWVGERGAGLSGGERQRIGIARVLLTDPRVLILDEATSSVDAESEAAIQAALREVVKGRTTIAIAHRLSTLRRADRIMVVDRGQVAELGTHRELIARNGTYARLLRLQGQDASPDALGAGASDEEADAGLNLPPLTGHKIRWLEPELAQIHLGNWNALHVTVANERIYGGVFALRCMPVRFPSHFISLRHLDSSGREQEIGIIRYLPRWPEEAQRLVREALLRRYFVHTIFAIRSMHQRGNYITVEADTDLGPVLFTMRSQPDRAQDFGGRGKLLLDTDENRYLIPDVEELPEKDRRLFRRYVYW